MKLLYYSPSSYGGLADYAHEQAIALTKQDVDVTVLCTPQYLKNRTPSYRTIPALRENSSSLQTSNKLLKAGYFIRNTLANFSTLARTIRSENFQQVLLGSYVEYLAPLWAGPLKRLSQTGVAFGAVVHDPVRDFVLGPLWWHRQSIAAGYSFLSEAFVHEAIQLDTVVPVPNLQTTIIPHGPYRFAEPSEALLETRSRLNLPPNAKVMLAFGHIRANKNLDLVIRAMAQIPDVYLVVAGKELTPGDCLVIQYQQLAERMGVSDRCQWEIRFIPEQEVANLFQAADLVLLTYDKTFHSASGVLNTAAGYQRPCLASSGEGPLATIVKKYALGLWIEPDNITALAKGIVDVLEHPPTPNWQQFHEDNSWSANAKLVKARFFSSANLELQPTSDRSVQNSKGSNGCLQQK